MYIAVVRSLSPRISSLHTSLLLRWLLREWRSALLKARSPSSGTLCTLRWFARFRRASHPFTQVFYYVGYLRERWFAFVALRQNIVILEVHRVHPRESMHVLCACIVFGMIKCLSMTATSQFVQQNVREKLGEIKPVLFVLLFLSGLYRLMKKRPGMGV